VAQTFVAFSLFPFALVSTLHRADASDDERQWIEGLHHSSLFKPNSLFSQFAMKTNFFAVAIPWAMSGTAFDSMTYLGAEATRFIQADRHRLNAARKAVGLEELPHPIGANWLIVPFKRDSKVSANLERRGCVALSFLSSLPSFPSLSPVLSNLFLPSTVLKH
jgi:hypothetical protein